MTDEKSIRSDRTAPLHFDAVLDDERSAGFSSEGEARGLAFSGGGIRSATFNLGVIQALAEEKLLQKFDYLSTISGGAPRATASARSGPGACMAGMGSGAGAACGA